MESRGWLRFHQQSSRFSVGQHEWNNYGPLRVSSTALAPFRTPSCFYSGPMFGGTAESLDNGTDLPIKVYNPRTSHVQACPRAFLLRCRSAKVIPTSSRRVARACHGLNSTRPEGAEHRSGLQRCKKHGSHVMTQCQCMRVKMSVVCLNAWSLRLGSAREQPWSWIIDESVHLL